MPITAFIVDDEPLARARIAALLRTDPEVTIVGEAGDGTSAIHAIESARPEIVFLDIEMPELDGLNMLSCLALSKLPVVIFTTAFDQYAVKAFEAQGLDYLLKPIKRERFFGALARAKEQIRSRRQGSAMRDRIPVRCGRRVVLVELASIDWIEAQANYVRFQCAGESISARETVGALETQLDPAKFARIHRSFIVNLDRVKELITCSTGELLVKMGNGRELPVGRSHRHVLDRLLSH